MHMLSVKKTKIFINTALLFVAVLYLIGFFVFYLNKDVSTWLETTSIEKYTARNTAKFEKAISSLKSDKPDETITLLRAWKSIGRGDRLYSQKRTMLLGLAKHYQEQGELEKLLELTNTWTSDDKRDITAIAFHAEALLHTKGKEELGFDLLEEYWNKFPSNKTLTSFLGVALKENNNSTSIPRFNQLILEKHSKSWRIYLDSGKGFNKDETKGFSFIKYPDENRYSATFTVSSTINKLRIDPRPSSTLLILGFEIQIENTPVQTIDLSTVKTHQMKFNGKTLEAYGEVDPFFHFPLNVPADHQHKKQIAITITCRLSSPSLRSETQEQEQQEPVTP